MPVVINELEIVAEPAPARPAPGPASAPPPGLTPRDVAAVVRHLGERRDRVEAD